MSPLDIILAGIAAFALMVFLGVVVGMELRRAREDREAREAYGVNQPSWPEVLGK